MSMLRRESTYLARYAGSGALNTAAGFSVIFLLTALGASPFTANAAGYLVGLVLGFVVTRKFVFVSQGHVTSEAVRYLTAFLFCFVLNLLTLGLALKSLQWPAIPAQLLAAAVYTASMYLLSRYLVFTPGSRR